ncbi:hypothetical protein [Streptomyces sp. NPDC054940]
MGPNDAQVVRVFSREPGSPISDVTLDPGQNGEIVLEAEAGRTLHQNGGRYTVTLVVRDLSDGSAIPVTGATVVRGNFLDANWPGLAARFTFTMSDVTLKAHAGSIAQAYGSVVYGTGEPGATFALSQPFQILPQ